MKRYGMKAFLLVFALIFTLMLPGCGAKKVDISTGEDENTQVTGTVDSTATTASKEDTSVKEASKKKKIIIVRTPEPIKDDQTNELLKVLKEKGYDSQNADITTLKFEGTNSQSQILETVQQIKPDIVFTFGQLSDIVKNLEGNGIPVVMESNAEGGFVDDTGTPKQNITGIYTMPSDMLKNSYEFLNKIVPVNGKKVVFLTAPGFPIFDKINVENALKPLNIQLKTYIGDIKSWEDWEADIKKYNNDNEVGWVLLGLNPMARKDGTAVDIAYIFKWAQENVKKPCISYWDEGVVSVGYVPCALAVNFVALGSQVGEMGARILNGEDIKSVKAESPKKMNIVINKKKADFMGMFFPIDVMGSAKVYTDYNGTYLK